MNPSTAPGRSRRPHLLLSLLLLPAAAGQVVLTEEFVFSTNPLPLTPPDPSAAGVSDTRSITSGIGRLTDVNVTMTLTNPFPGGAYNGDYFVSLVHESGFAVLLNRVGKRDGTRPDEQLGYSDNGFQITLDDQAANGDVHVYRLKLGPGATHNTPVDVNFELPLTGAWASDGRNPGTANVTISTPRTAVLSSFNDLPASGSWTLFVADLNAGGTATLENWSLQFTGAPIPEPAPIAAAAGGALLVWGVGRRWRCRGAEKYGTSEDIEH